MMEMCLSMHVSQMSHMLFSLIKIKNSANHDIHSLYSLCDTPYPQVLNHNALSL